ncbi:Protein of unknown function DUF677 [Cynara cardunculus var. scolymus]|uniref:Uncharacterized protein n=1 Tax=Cynara cardunculus var. scolymus TaxID=59895 RepID=A0A103Y1A8_CYNCS|nr:Protein of unknown function DUF677 [Cynara cardunculus var. scolymus]
MNKFIVVALCCFFYLLGAWQRSGFRKGDRIVVLICFVVAAAIVAPPVAASLAAAIAIPLGSMGKWINCLLKNYENTIKGK